MSLTYEQFHKIKQMCEADELTATQAAAELDLDVRTVQRALASKAFVPRKSARRASKLDPFKEEIKRLLERHEYTAVQVARQIRELGYEGGQSILKEYVHLIRPRPPQAFLTLQHDQGECAQVDWGSYGTISTGETCRKLSFFVMVLMFSRLMYVAFTVLETLEQFLECHRRAFEFFGGVPRQVVIDNLKTGVLSHSPGLPAKFHPRYVEMAQHYGFKPVACNPHKPHEKGGVESGVGYVKNNFLRGHGYPSLGVLQSAAQNWLDTVANIRVHATTGKRPVDLFVEEKPHLLPLHPMPFDTSITRMQRASSQFRITVDTNRYSVPWRYASKLVTVKLYLDHLTVYDGDKLLARHARCYDRRRDFEDPEQVKEILLFRRKAQANKLLTRFLALHTCAETYYRNLDLRRANPMIHVRNIMALHDLYGPDAIVNALQAALRFDAYGHDYIAHLLETQHRDRPEPTPLRLTRNQEQLELELPAPNLDIYE